MEKVSCVIPFYNEDPGQVKIIVRSVKDIPEVSQIICIDDGSANNTAGELEKAFPGPSAYMP
jgi:glycosyltransferase involved in cell wall biosynthesis